MNGVRFGVDPVRSAVETALQRLEDGERLDASFECQVLDLKEEAGRRDANGEVRPGQPTNQVAAKHLAGEAACMANTPGGGALIVGVTDSGDLIGTALEVEWLRHRIYELTAKQLTVGIYEAVIRDARLLVVMVPSAVEPIRINGRITWRVADRCVEIDAASWHAQRLDKLHYDWSGDESTVPVGAVRPAAVSIARDFLRQSQELAAMDLAESSDAQLLRRLGVVTHDGRLTNAGVLAFVGRREPALDYIRRDHAGGDSVMRVRQYGRSLLEDLAEVISAINVNNPIQHLHGALTIGQTRLIPPLAARETIVNGLAHREWGSPEATVVEHIGQTLRVTSPGGFFGDVTQDNIITHPSQSRNRALTQLLADLRVAEREGIGVDRMIRDMLYLGYPKPNISEIAGPFVRVTLVCNPLDQAWISWLKMIEPSQIIGDVNNLLILHQVLYLGWIDLARTEPLIQLQGEEAEYALRQVRSTQIGQQTVLGPVGGVPPNAAAAWCLTPTARMALQQLDRQSNWSRQWPNPQTAAQTYASARGRISSTELASIVAATRTNLGPALKDLELQGVLEPAWPSRRGRGFYYKAVGVGR